MMKEMETDDLRDSLSDSILAWSICYSMVILNIFGFFIFERGESWFRNNELPDSVTVFSSFLLFLLFFTGLMLYLRGRKGVLRVVSFIPLYSIGYFLLQLEDDWFTALFIFCINMIMLYYFSRQLQPRIFISQYRERVGRYPRHFWYKSEAWLSGGATGMTILVGGYSFHDITWCLFLIGTVLFPLVLLSIGWNLPERLKGGFRGPWFEWLVLLCFPFVFQNLWYLIVLLTVRQCFRMFVLLKYFHSIQRLMQQLFIRPAQLMVFSFAAVIIIGTLMLTFPVASSMESTVNPLDGLFTATSATCVTGLIVLDTPTDFSLFGQIIILVLIQTGGLGIITLSTFALLLIGSQIGLSQQWALSDIIEEKDPRALFRMIRFIVWVTLTIEGLGALVLAAERIHNGMMVREAIWFGIFHSVSAFCNAGFALQSDSLISFQNNPLVLTTLTVLIILGGIGFSVLAQSWSRIQNPGYRQKWNLQTKLVFQGTIILLVGGMVLFLALESSGVLKHRDFVSIMTNSLFQSATTRTAGFNSVPIEDFQRSTTFFFIIWMFIGASPGSAGGGVKVTTIVILLLTIGSIIRGKGSVEVFERTIPNSIILKATALISLSALIISLVLFTLLVTQPFSFVELLFESVSAFATVGLSTGITPHLNEFGKMLIIFLMFIGRLGPLTLVLTLEIREKQLYRYPEEQIMIG